MKFIQINALAALCVLLLTTITPIANAGLITITLGNGVSGLVDGDKPTACQLLCDPGIMYGQEAPFGAIHGWEDLTDPDNVNWLFNYGIITDTIINASFSFGIFDHDSSASGSQLDAFSLGGIDLTANLDTMFEAGGGSVDLEYKVYNFNLGNSFFANLANGLFSVDLNIGGNALVTNGSTQAVSEVSNGNRYGLIYSTLIIETQDFVEPDPDPIPEPSTLTILALGFMGIGLRRFKK